MAEQKTSNIDTIAPGKPGMITDLNPSYIGKENYTYARNAVANSKEGDLGTISNEQSNTLCFEAPYKIVGSVNLPDDEVMIFSGDGKSSEIGIGSIKTCQYRKIYSNSCLNFNKDYPISGVARKDFQKGTIVTFTDKYNPVRRIELKKISTSTTCDDILLFKNIDHPCLTLAKGDSGNMPDGMYSVAIAYVVDNQVFSDWYSITNRVPLNGNRNSINLSVDNLDTEFKKFAVVVVGNYIDPTTKGATKLAKQIGIFSTKTKVISITDFINDDYLNIPLSNLVIHKTSWQKAGIISSNSNYLILGDLVYREEENYQLKAMSIMSEYVIEQVPVDYYEIDGQDVSYYGDENYDFYIQGVYKTGELTDKYHIAGRLATSNDRSSISSQDVFEYDADYCDTPPKIEKWQVVNTAETIKLQDNPFVCNRRVLGTGKMGYYQSTEVYPDNVEMYGEWANKPIRYHKFPDECNVPRYSIINGKTYINIKGIRFKNIPSFSNPDIVGYKITRSDRKGGNGTVVARGLMTNMRSYMDPQVNQEVLYSNYPVNNLGDDNFLSSTQTVFKNNKETNFTPLTTYYKDKFSFYSPHTQFEPRYSLGNEIKIECEEIATVTGKFEKVYNHPKAKLLNQFAFWLSAAVGFIEASIVVFGKTDISSGSEFKIEVGLSTNVSKTWKSGSNLEIKTVDDLISLSPGQLATMIKSAITSLDGGGILAVGNLVLQALKVIAVAALKGPYSIFAGIAEAERMYTIIQDFTGYTDYVYQYNSLATFNSSKCVTDGNKRRRLINPALYIPSDVVSVEDKLFNNYFREKTVLLEFNKPINDPTTKDTSNNTMKGFGACETKQSTSVGSAFYVTNKAINPNQYGRVGSAQAVSLHSCVYKFNGDLSTTPILYGGDCIITRYQYQKRMQFFNQNIANTNYPDGTEYDYRMYRNIAYPRFWIDSTKYDFSSILNKKMINFAQFTRTTTSKHNLDCKQKNDGKTITRIDDAYMYLSNNTVMDFIVEADYNPNFRDKTDRPFYYKDNKNLSEIFRSDRLSTPEEFNINRVYSDLYTTEIFAPQQRDDYSPLDPIPSSQPNSVIYSLPSFNLQEVDNWQYFLPANFFSFRESDFGILTNIQKLDQDRLIFLFSKSSPYISMGRDFLQLEGSGRKVTIGDGGLFAQDPREIMPTDNNYAASNSKYAFSNTHMGRYYPSESQGRIIQYTNNLDDVTRAGMSYWCKNYMPIKLYQYYPNYLEIENPINGVGYLTVFDSFNETIYITKRDFAPKLEYQQDITYNGVTFLYKSTPISLRSSYFNDISWTLSYSPAAKAFISYHDWHPDWVIQTDNHFMSVKDNKVWKHNENNDSYCNFYGVDYPFEIEYISNGGQQVETVRSIEYLLEVYHYKNNGRNRFHVLNENFDNLIVSNTEQISPLLNLIKGNPNPEENIQYPKISSVNNVSYDVTFFKEENKYRVNQFWDTTKDRGEFTTSEYHLLATDESGYKSVINPIAIDLNKPEEQRKKFRHYFNKFRLIKKISGNNKFITKLINIKKLISLR